MASKWRGIQNVQSNIAGDVKRVKAMKARAMKQVEDAKKKAKAVQDDAKKYGDQAKAAAGQAQAAYGQVGGALGNAKGAMGGGMGGMLGGGPGAPPGAPRPPGAPGAPMMGGMTGMPGAPGMPGGGGFGQAMGGMPGQPMMGAPMTGPPQPGQRTMAIMAGGSSGMAAIGWLVPLKGSRRGELITLKPQAVIGKDPTCDVCINDAFMSSRHATIRAQNGIFVLEDHSTNGTYVNDKKISRHELVDSDILKVGQTLIKFKAL